MKTPPIQPVQPADRIGDLTPYTPPARNPRITLTLDNNEGAPIDPAMLGMLNGLDADTLARYPDQSPLEAQIAQSMDIDASRVVLTNGGDDAIDRVCRALLNPGDVMLTHTPGFVMIPCWAQLAGARNNTIEWLGGPFPRDAFVDAIDDSTKLVALVSPCNPTGAAIAIEDIRAVAERANAAGAAVLLDQAYIEFADEDPIAAVLGLPNVVAVRTFSKAMGLAGLRVGYAIAPASVAGWLRTVGGPYPVATPSLLLAAAAFEQREQRDVIIEQTRANRGVLIQALRSRGIETLDSQANFVLARFEDAAESHAALLGQGVSVRCFRAGGDIESYLRITVPADKNQLNQLLNALKAIGAAS